MFLWRSGGKWLSVCVTPNSPWSVRFKVDVSFPLSSFRTTSYTPESFLEICPREQEQQVQAQNNAGLGLGFVFIWTGKLSLLRRMLQITQIYDAKSKKADRQNDENKRILRQDGKTRQQTDNCSQLLVFSRLCCLHSLQGGGRAEMGHTQHHVRHHVLRLFVTRTDVWRQNSGMGREESESEKLISWLC